MFTCLFDDKLVVDFSRCVVQLLKKNRYYLDQISNTDQTPFYFEMPFATPVDNYDQKFPNFEKEDTKNNDAQSC